MNNSPIGIIDSGCGGLSIWESVVSLLPKESTLYIGDHRFLPYSKKSELVIHERITKLITCLIRNYSCKLVVIACNTATVAGIDVYRRAFPHVPIVGVVPVVKTASETTKSGHIAILSTVFTAQSAYQNYLMRTYASTCKVHNIGSADLVALVERGMPDSSEVERVLHALLLEIRGTPVDVLALGCTHYPFLRTYIQRVVGPGVTLLDSGGAVARQVARILDTNGMASTAKTSAYRFFTTGDATNVSRVATILMKRTVRFLHIDCQ